MITDEMLHTAAARSSELFVQAAAFDYDPAQQYRPSDLFEKKIKRLFHRAKHPYFYQVLRRIAAIFLAAVLAGGAYLAVDAEARAAFLGWVREVYENSALYRIAPNRTSATLPRLTLTWLPDGFGEPEVYEDDTMYSALYENPDTGDVFILGYELLNDERQTELFTARQPEHLLVRGTEADFYPADDNSDFNNLLWIDADTGVFCTIDGTLNKDVILHIAVSMYLTNPEK